MDENGKKRNGTFIADPSVDSVPVAETTRQRRFAKSFTSEAAGDPLTWLVPDMLAQHRFNTLLAPQKSGKTTVLLDIIAGSLGYSRTPFPVEPVSGRVLLYVLEDQASRIRDGLLARGVPDAVISARVLIPDEEEFIEVLKDSPRLDEGHYPTLRAIIRDYRVSLCIADTLFNAMKGSPIKDDKKAALFVHQLNRICLEEGATVLATHHNTKSAMLTDGNKPPPRALNAGAGITEFLAALKTGAEVYTVQSIDGEDEIWLLPSPLSFVNPHDAHAYLFSIENHSQYGVGVPRWIRSMPLKDFDKRVHELYGGGKPVKKPGNKDVLQRAIAYLAKAGEFSRDDLVELCEAFGAVEASIKDHIADLIKAAGLEGERQSSGRTVYRCADDAKPTIIEVEKRGVK